jgi:four helix bundle protein
MGTTTPVFDIRERSVEFSLRSLDLYQTLLRTRAPEARILGNQFLRAVPSFGANLHEASAAESTADFIHKNASAKNEAVEVTYWLKILLRSKHLQDTNVVLCIPRQISWFESSPRSF